jgi:hypothetical protein
MERTFSLPSSSYTSRNEAERAVLRAALAQRMQFDVMRSSTGYGTGGRRLALRCHTASCRGSVVFEARGRTLILDVTRSVMSHSCARRHVRAQRRIILKLVRDAGMHDAERWEIRAFLAARGVVVSDSTVARVQSDLQRTLVPAHM